VTPGGWSSILYTFRQAHAAGGVLRMWRALRSRNACKTCAVGMGGQAGGMVNEEGEFPEFCKKSVQAMAADLQAPIPASFWQVNPIPRMASMSPRQLEASGRLAEPLLRENGADHYRPVSWDEAMERAASVLAATPPDRSFFYFSGRSSSEAAFLLQLAARLYGTNNINNCSYYCHQASGVGLQSVTGSGTATVVLEDLSKADTVVLIGANPASNHPRLMKSLLGVRRRGGQVIVVNPIREAGLERFSVPSDPRSLLFGSRIATHVVQPHIGGDAALLCGVARSLIDRDLLDQAFLDQSTVGFDAFRADILAMDWSDIEAGSGQTRHDIEHLADRICAGKRVIFAWAMGVTHHRHGTATVQLIAAIAMLRGVLGQPGCGLMPIRGHSNVQGIGSIGVTPNLKKAIFDGLTTRHGLRLPTSPGLDTMACMQAVEEGRVDVGLHLGGNLFGSNPDADWAARALSGLPWQITLSTTLNTGHARAASPNHLILPVLARDEEPQPTTQESMFNFVRLSSGGPARFEGPRSEIDVVAELFGRVGALRATENDPLRALDWPSMTDTAGLRRMMADVVPGWEALSDLDHGGEEFQIAGRTFHTPHFATSDGKARFQRPVLPETTSKPDALRLMTIRSEGQFNTVVYEEEDLYRGPKQRDVVLLHPDDMARIGLTDGQRVRVEGPGGRMLHQRIFAFDRIRPGNAAMYFPEANQLLDRGVDASSRTPAFKGAWITLQP
jgi:molybdopterin-dependent oxidoreductase alpha subunit